MRGDRVEELPAEIRDLIEKRTGLIARFQSASGGSNANIAATLHTADGQIFVKAARKPVDGEGPGIRSLRREAVINPYIREFTPRLLWHLETKGWVALGFECVAGRHADYSPGSPDLAVLAKVIHRLQDTSCPDVVEMRVERRWASLACDVSAMAGDALLHTDLNPKNLLITLAGRVHAVDWAFASRGASWVEVGQTVRWLIRAGHSPAEAEEWASQFPSWTTADPVAIDLYAQLSAERWRRHAESKGVAKVPEYVAVAQRWADHRKSRLP
ncbi:hypothetical protein SAMN04489712_10415 [Thermomonospora echinospora]|uniref:Aminoglycoside phosphotransferase domain-containing protein n=1 Tax=Thermomonospora echinospora TaxID=1992 RepID=A0A1H5YHC8_9ACTN|nr:aminoglycoside phosphotransferase [Thermomonospora echinospora]SEG23493.1 hypothetical protein SAMN04489712_10415 [Thermomonospora echinospora]